MIDSILEGKIYDGLFKNQSGLTIYCQGHPQKYFLDSAKLSFAEFLAAYMSIKLTTADYEEKLKDFYEIIGEENKKELENFSNSIFNIKRR